MIVVYIVSMMLAIVLYTCSALYIFLKMKSEIKRVRKRDIKCLQLIINSYEEMIKQSDEMIKQSDEMIKQSDEIFRQNKKNRMDIEELEKRREILNK